MTQARQRDGTSKSPRTGADHGRSCAVAVMAKASAPGRTKTRLCPPLAPEEAARFNTAFIKDIAANIEAAGRLSADRAPVVGAIAYGPEGAGAFFRSTLGPKADCFEAALPNFGACLRFALGHLLARGHVSAAVLNADSPTLPPALLAEMADILAAPGDRAVLGPSTDGGYYVLGLKTPHPRLFEDIDWSTEKVADQTMARAREIGLELHLLPAWYDVDDKAALRTLHGELFDNIPFGLEGLARGAAHHTRALMDELLETAGLAARLDLESAAPALPGRAPSPTPTQWTHP